MKKIIRGAVYYVDFTPNIGHEQGGFRPAVIIQKDTGNKFSETTIVVPISTRQTGYKKQPTHVDISTLKKIRPKSIVLLEQIKTIDKSRLKGYICDLSEQEMSKIDEAICVSLGLK